MDAVFPAKIVFASGNRGKLREVRRLFTAHDIEILPQSALGVSEAAETGTTFRENSLIKSRHAAAVTGLAALADDSGLVVAALGGEPGIRSARYAGPGASDADNVARLLKALDGVPAARRIAAFRCVASFVDPALDPAAYPPLIGEGLWQGRILDTRRGRRGFGYDPVFFDPVAGKSAAELDAAEKNAASHRGQALRALLTAFARRYAPP